VTSPDQAPSSDDLFAAYTAARDRFPDGDPNHPDYIPRVTDPEDLARRVGDLAAMVTSLGEQAPDASRLASMIGLIHGANSGDTYQMMREKREGLPPTPGTEPNVDQG